MHSSCRVLSSRYVSYMTSTWTATNRNRNRIRIRPLGCAQQQPQPCQPILDCSCLVSCAVSPTVVPPFYSHDCIVCALQPQATQQTAAKVLKSSMEQLQMIMDVVDDEENPFTEGAAEGSQYLITGVFLEAATWENGALALTNQMLNRLPTVRITWLVEGSQVRFPKAYRRLASRLRFVLLCCVPTVCPCGTLASQLTLVFGRGCRRISLTAWSCQSTSTSRASSWSLQGSSRARLKSHQASGTSVALRSSYGDRSN